MIARLSEAALTLRGRRIPLARLFDRLSAEQLEIIAEAAIERLDAAAGDPDIEANGDEFDGTAGEDDFYPHSNWRQEPGCPVADPDGDAEQFLAERPLYGIDQSSGPINHATAAQAQVAAAAGLVRNARGGWSYAA